MTAFSGENLTCVRQQSVVFENLSFCLESGRILGLTGPNGSGKTSLLRLMGGLLEPAAGSLTEALPAHWIGPENPLQSRLSVAENLTFWACMLRTSSDRESILGALCKLAMESLADTPVQYLSAGQRRRANLCRLFLGARPLWLLDEPESGLDEETTIQLCGLVRDHVGHGGRAVIATHRPDFWKADTEVRLG